MSRKRALEILNSKDVGFITSSSLGTFGHMDALISWFDTICYRLENSKRGSRFPLLKKLYDDEHDGVLYEEFDAFKLEIETIQNELSKLHISQAIWNIDNPKEKIPANHPNLNYNAKNLAEFYKVNYSDEIIFDVLRSSFFWMENDKTNCYIMNIGKAIIDKSRMIIDGKRVRRPSQSHPIV